MRGKRLSRVDRRQRKRDMSTLLSGQKINDNAANSDELFDESREFAERKHVRAVAERAVRIGMRLAENRVAPAGHGGAGQIGNHFALAAGRGSSRQLNAMRRVEDDGRSETLHDGNRPHIVHQPPVAERRPASVSNTFWLPASSHFFTM